MVDTSPTAVEVSGLLDITVVTDSAGDAWVPSRAGVVVAATPAVVSTGRVSVVLIVWRGRGCGGVAVAAAVVTGREV